MRRVHWAGKCSKPTFPLHAHGQALLVAAVLTPVPLSFVDQAVLVVTAGVGQIFAYCPLEEALAALTTVYPIVLACQVGKEAWVNCIDKSLTHVPIMLQAGALPAGFRTPVWVQVGCCLALPAHQRAALRTSIIHSA